MWRSLLRVRTALGCSKVGRAVARFTAAEAGYRVGYEDAAHFSRDYKRRIGEPPMRKWNRCGELA